MSLSKPWPGHSALNIHRPQVGRIVRNSLKAVNAETDLRELAGDDPNAQLAAEEFMKLPAAIRGDVILTIETAGRRQ